MWCLPHPFSPQSASRVLSGHPRSSPTLLRLRQLTKSLTSNTKMTGDIVGRNIPASYGFTIVHGRLEIGHLRRCDELLHPTRLDSTRPCNREHEIRTDHLPQRKTLTLTTSFPMPFRFWRFFSLCITTVASKVAIITSVKRKYCQ